MRPGWLTPLTSVRISSCGPKGATISTIVHALKTQIAPLVCASVHAVPSEAYTLVVMRALFHYLRFSVSRWALQRTNPSSLNGLDCVCGVLFVEAHESGSGRPAPGTVGLPPKVLCCLRARFRISHALDVSRAPDNQNLVVIVGTTSTISWLVPIYIGTFVAVFCPFRPVLSSP